MIDGLAEWLIKSAGHKYLRRIPTGNPKRKWTYVYARQSKHHDREFAIGEKIKLTHGKQVGHYEVKATHGDFVTLRHDETGHDVSIHRDKLAQMFSDEHHAKPMKARPKVAQAHKASKAAQTAGTAASHRAAAKANDHAADSGARHSALHRKLATAHSRAAETIEAKARIEKRKAAPKFVIKLARKPKPGFLGNKNQAWDALMEAIDEMPQGYSIANQKYLAWKGEASAGRAASKQEAKWGKGRPKRSAKPDAWQSGELDSINEALNLQKPGRREKGQRDPRVSSPLEGFARLTAGIKRWDDPRMKDILGVMRDVPGLKQLRLPEGALAKEKAIDKEAEAYYREQQAQGVDTSFDPDDIDAEPDFDDSFDFGFNAEEKKSMSGLGTIGEYLEKAKYVRRTGTPGNYRYEYDRPGGGTVSTPSRGAADPNKDAARKEFSQLKSTAFKYSRMGRSESEGENAYHTLGYMMMAVTAAKQSFVEAKKTYDPSLINRAKEDIADYELKATNLRDHVKQGTDKVVEIFKRHRASGVTSMSMKRLRSAAPNIVDWDRKLQAGLSNLGYEVKDGKVQISHGMPGEIGSKNKAFSDSIMTFKEGESIESKDFQRIADFRNKVEGGNLSANDIKTVIDHHIGEGHLRETATGFEGTGVKKSMNAIDKLSKNLETTEIQNLEEALVKGGMYRRTDEWASQFMGTPLYLKALQILKDKMLCEREYAALSTKAVDYNELEEMPRSKRRAIRDRERKARAKIDTKRDGLDVRGAELDAALLDYKIVEEKKQRTGLKRSDDAIDNLSKSLEKAGEGSRGGKVTGHTASGKPIYAKEGGGFHPTATHAFDAAHKDMRANLKRNPQKAAAAAEKLIRLIQTDKFGYYKPQLGELREVVAAGKSEKSMTGIELLESFAKGSGATVGETTTSSPQKNLGDAGSIGGDDAAGTGALPHGENKGDGGVVGTGASGRPSQPGGMGASPGGMLSDDDVPVDAQMADSPQWDNQRRGSQLMMGKHRKSEHPAGTRMTPATQLEQSAHERAIAVQRLTKSDDIRLGHGVEPGDQLADQPLEKAEHRRVGDLVHMSNESDLAVERMQKSSEHYQGGMPAMDLTGDLRKSKRCVGGGNHLMPANLTTCPGCGSGSTLGVRGPGVHMAKSGGGLHRPYEPDLDLSKGLTIPVEK